MKVEILLKKAENFNKLFTQLKDEYNNDEYKIKDKVQLYQEVIHTEKGETPSVLVEDIVPYGSGCLVIYSVVYTTFTARELMMTLSIEDITNSVEEYKNTL